MLNRQFAFLAISNDSYLNFMKDDNDFQVFLIHYIL